MLTVFVFSSFSLNFKLRFHIYFFTFHTDNHAAHHVQQIRQMIENTGAILVYLPPYSPELNPIEEVFSIVKQWLYENDHLMMITADPSYLIFRAFLEIQSQNVKAIYSHCGY